MVWGSGLRSLLLCVLSTEKSRRMATGPWPLVKPLLDHGMNSPELHLSHANIFKGFVFRSRGLVRLVLTA